MLSGVAAVLLGLALIVVLAVVLSGQDEEATTGAPAAGAPGVPAQAPSPVGEGNVLVVHREQDRAALRALVRDLTGVTERGEQEALLRAGQGVELRCCAERLRAYAGGRALAASGPADPELRRFAEYWLGRPAG